MTFQSSKELNKHNEVIDDWIIFMSGFSVLNYERKGMPRIVRRRMGGY